MDGDSENLKRFAPLAGGFVMLALAGWVAYRNAPDDHNEAYRQGYVMGAIVGPLAVAVVVRWVYLRIRSSDRPVVTPTVFAVVAGITLLLAFGRAGAENDSDGVTVAELNEVVERGEEACKDVDPLARLSAAFSARPLPPSEIAALRNAAPPGAEALVESIEAFDIYRGTKLVSFVFAIPLGGDDDERADALKGVEDSMRDQGYAISRVDVSGQQAIRGAAAGETRLAAQGECHVTIVVATDFPKARAVAEPLFAQ